MRFILPRRHHLFWLAALLLAVPGAAHEAGHRQHGTHEHGVALLDAAVDGHALYLALTSPGVNLVGFEHRPRDAAEAAAVDAALAALRDPAAVVSLPPPAGCVLQRAEASSGLGGPAPDGTANAHQHGQGHAHAHEEHEKPGEHGEHGEDHAAAGHDHGPNQGARHGPSHGHEHGGSTHGELSASWLFRCARPEALDAVEVRLFETFPGIDRIRVQRIGPEGQGAAELTPGNPRFPL